jgi:hypothetical protein
VNVDASSYEEVWATELKVGLGGSGVAQAAAPRWRTSSAPGVSAPRSD